MNKFFSYFLTLGVLLLTGINVLAQTVQISAEIRPRYEFRHGYKTLVPDDAKAANFISQRTRLNAFFGNKNFKAFISLQDVRVWGDVDQLNVKDVNGFGVHEAWGDIRISDHFSLKIGRQEVSYDDQRMFGAVGWTQQARSHDAALLKFSVNDDHSMEAGLGYNAMSESLFREDYTRTNYKTIQWLHYHGNFNNSGLSLLFLNNGLAYDNDPDPSITEEKISYSQTIGGRYNVGINQVKADASFYFQGGKNRARKDLRAYYFSANVTYQATGKFNIGAGTEILSGTTTVDQNLPDQTDHSFSPFYGTNHKFNGWMDYFYVGNYAGQNGLIDIYVPLVIIVKKWNFALRPHYFIAAAKVSTLDQDNQPLMDYGNGLGAEIDLQVQYILSESVSFMGGYSQMLATETMQVVKYPEIPSGEYYKNSNNWAWLMVTFKPTFFSKE
jgi:hypothetical protein